VGFDDNRELDLEGAKSALPIWTEFMKRALEYKEYKNAKPFDAPDGIVPVQIDPLSGQLATPACPGPRQEVFIAGTQPLETCRLHGGSGPSVTHVTGWETQPPQTTSVPTPSNLSQPPISALPRVVTGDSPAPPAATAEQAEKAKEKKKGFFGRVFGVFK
jgi:penicillin-binding protein 1B